MKKRLSTLILIVLCFAFMLVGCSTNLSIPSSDASVNGNGGFVVQKGEYIYFANAYTGYTNMSGTVSNDDKEYAIYRVKATDYINGNITYDEDGMPENVELIASKVAGFENLGMYIIGDYLYFSSPNMHKTNKNENRFDLVTIYSVKLDGTSLKELYTTDDYTNGHWSVLQIETKAYLITVEGANIIRQEINNGSLSNKTTLVSDLAGAILVDEVKSDFDKKIYYTTARTKEETDLGLTGNILKNVNIANGEIASDNNPVGQTITLLCQQNSKLFYTIKTTNSAAKLYAKNLTGADTLLMSYFTDSSSLFFLGYENDGTNRPLVFVNSTKLVMVNYGSSSITVLVDSDATPIFTSGDYIYYSTTAGISRISYKDKTAQVIVAGTFQSGEYDFDGRYVYAYSKIDSSTTDTMYVVRVDLHNLEQNVTVTLKPVGYILDSDKPKDEDED